MTASSASTREASAVFSETSFPPWCSVSVGRTAMRSLVSPMTDFPSLPRWSLSLRAPSRACAEPYDHRNGRARASERSKR